MLFERETVNLVEHCLQLENETVLLSITSALVSVCQFSNNDNKIRVSLFLKLAIVS